MYLSRLYLNFRNYKARRDLGDPYEMHSSLVRAFVSSSEVRAPRFLWRVEPTRMGEVPVLLLQSAQRPDFSALEGVSGYLMRSSQGKGSECKPFDLERLVQAGARYRLRLIANPTVTREGKRRGLVGEGAQLAWLARQGDRHGFGVESAVVVTSDYIKSCKRKTSTTMSLCRVHYEGYLYVNDAAKLRAVIHSGLGPGKALGCGLLSLGRV